MRDGRSQWEVKADALQRFIMWFGLSRFIQYYLVAEYPKSGGTWFCQMLSTYLGIPYPRNQRPHFILKPCILQGHFLPSRCWGKNVFCVIRDGRDVIVSAYYHFLIHSDRNIPWVVERTRRAMPFDDYEDIEKNLPPYIEYMFTGFNRGAFHFRWDEFIYSCLEKDVTVVRYEDLLENTVNALYAAIYEVTGKDPDLEKLQMITQQFSFENQTGRKRGEENVESFLRNGVAGGWKQKMSREAREVFDYFAGKALIAAGYETDRSWVDDCRH
ncbi:MAG TPA: hypothetical protein DEP84_07265 [Chloroflexi bacterium]|nr:hypothetical protein [Chloroflexota bacterium]